MKNLIFMFLLFSYGLNAQQIPACIDQSYAGCKEGFCLTSIENLCWIQNYIDKVFPSARIDIIKQYEKLDLTPMTSKISKENAPWGAYYFPYKNGGITQRWQSKSKPHQIDSNVLDLSILREMNAGQLNQLSPALKLDLFLNDSNFSFTRIELERRTDKRRESLNAIELNGGFCNGARAAGVLWQEPTKQVVVNTSISNIRPFVFYPTDIKAILSASFFHPQHVIAFGSNSIANDLCAVDPISFDILIRCLISKLKKPFYIDADKTKNIDNKTVLKFDRTIKSVENIGDVKKVTISMVIMTLAEYDPLSANKETKSEIYKLITETNLKKIAASDLNNRQRQKFQFYKYEYEISVDTNDKIIYDSSKWVTSKETSKPDFAWVAWGDGNDDCSYYDNLESSGNPNLHFKDVKYLASKSY
jgi:hypothetical protein